MKIKNIANGLLNKTNANDGAAADGLPPAPHPSSDESKRPSFKGEILVCEDNVINRDIIKSHLTKVGFCVHTANNGKEGVDMVSSRMAGGNEPFGLIFMDIQMPVMNGLEASGIISGFNIETPIVALTADVTPENQKIFKEHGMSGCLGKPFTAADLWSCLYEYFTPVGYEQIADDERLSEQEKQKAKLYTGFVRRNQSTYGDICGAIERGDIKLAHRLAHTLRGLAGLMGKKELQEAARIVESSLSGGDASSLTEKDMDTLERELNLVLTELAPYMEKPKSVEKPKNWDKTAAKELFDKLEALLNADSAACRDTTDALRKLPGTDELIGYIEEYEFEAALTALSRLRKSMEV